MMRRTVLLITGRRCKRFTAKKCNQGPDDRKCWRWVTEGNLPEGTAGNCEGLCKELFPAAGHRKGFGSEITEPGSCAQCGRQWGSQQCPVGARTLWKGFILKRDALGFCQSC